MSSPLGRTLAWRLAVVTMVIVAAVSLLGMTFLEQRESDRIALELDATQRSIEREWERQASALTASLQRFVGTLKDDDAALAMLGGGDRIAPDVMQRWAAESGADLLEVSLDGRVLGSAHWPQRVELEPMSAPAEAAMRSLPTIEGDRDGWIVQQEWQLGNRRWRWIAGRFLPAVTQLSEHPQVELVEVVEDIASDTAPRIQLPGGEVWQLRWVESPQTVQERRRLRLGWIGLTVVSGLIAALVGRALGRQVARPVDELVRAVDAIARGEEDYSFAALPQNELDQLAASFSRLQRALDQQTERRAAAERVAVWREAARHVAHEVKNPLVPIRLTVENLRRAHQEKPQLFESIFADGTQTILEEVDQLTRLVGEFSEFARLPLPEKRACDLRALLDETLDLFATPEVTIERRFADRLPTIDADRDQLSRVFKNIVANAIQAQQGGDAARVVVGATVDEQGVSLRFEDDGPGLGEEAKRRLFEPYFTTKDEGTGLGLAISYRIVVEHGGEIFAGDAASGGARIEIRLPLPAGES